ncbi:MAG: O-succinylbenzoic acid--CoA ligase [Flavobacteriaceae bacterium]|nr:O-succinylbenzoic acid--CoA ligase [Flavobacteriaceae bacterium]
MGYKIHTLMLVHASFRLNGRAFKRNALDLAAQQWADSADEDQQALGYFLINWLSEYEYIALHTSGSTGKPKEIHMPKTAMYTSAVRTATFFNLSAGDSALLCLPIRYIAGKMMLVRALVLGLNLDIKPPKTKLHIEKNYSFTALIPSQANALFDSLGKFKTVLIGGAPIPSELRKRIGKTYSHCVETYGMTETLTHVAARTILDADKPFKAMPGIGFSTDENGCLVIEAPYLPLSPVVTQDLVSLEGNGNFKLLGRRDWVINSGGIKIFPETLEVILAPYMKFPFFFTAMPDAELGEKLVLLAEAPASKKGTIMTIARQHLGKNKYHIPKAVVCITNFKFTSTGKLDRIASQKVAMGT